MQNFIAFIKSKTFALHFSLGIVLLTLIFVFTYQWLNAYTNHGETVSVPNLKGMRVSQLEQFLKGKNLSYKVTDSSVFMLDKPAGTVVEQDPYPNSHVKENRIIYITITRSIPPQVFVPNLIDVSQRQAEAILASYGLIMGSVSYQPDLAKNAVLGMLMNGVTLKPGDEIPKGSVIDFILGDGLGNTEVTIPKLQGLTFEEAMFVLKGSSLTAGDVVFDDGVSDTANAVVYRQQPEPGDTVLLKQGESIDLYLK